MNHRHILPAVTAAFVLAISSAALAQGGAEQFLAKRFQQLDKDGEAALGAAIGDFKKSVSF